jgi:hypothetical protein
MWSPARSRTYWTRRDGAIRGTVPLVATCPALVAGLGHSELTTQESVSDRLDRLRFQLSSGMSRRASVPPSMSVSSCSLRTSSSTVT